MVAPQIRLKASIRKARGKLSFPLEKGRVEVRFGRAVDPRFGTVTLQNGIDVRAPAGTAVRAVWDGKVAHAGWFKGFGNLLIIDHGERIFSLIEHNYVEPVDETRLLYGAIEGMVRTLDPHSSFMDPRAYSALKEETEGEYGVVGLELASRGDDVVVVAPLDDTPAARAGFKPGDKLVEIDGEPVRGWHEADAVHSLMGPPGTKVVIKALRASWTEPRSFTLVRDVIRVVSVEDRLFDKKLGYIKIKNF